MLAYLKDHLRFPQTFGYCRHLEFMMEKQPHIIDCLKADYSIDVAALTFLALGADPNATVYKALARDGSSYFVKLKQGRHQDISVTIVSLLQNAGIRQIIPPIKTLQGRLTQHTGDFTLIVYPFIEGRDAFNHNLTEDQWMTLGKFMRQVHEFNVPL